MVNLLNSIFFTLLNHFGPQNWWPAETIFEIMVGAILTQNTSWKNVEKAILNLKKENILSPKGLKEINDAELAILIKSAGFFNIKSKRLKNFIIFLEKYDFDFDRMKSIENLREELLKIKGVGKETADSILLYAFDKPYFVIDAYTKRIFSRIGFLNEKDSYDNFQALFHSNLPRNSELYNEYHALIVRLAKDYCKKVPECLKCPIKDLCQYGKKIT